MRPVGLGPRSARTAHLLALGISLMGRMLPNARRGHRIRWRPRQLKKPARDTAAFSASRFLGYCDDRASAGACAILSISLRPQPTW